MIVGPPRVWDSGEGEEELLQLLGGDVVGAVDAVGVGDALPHRVEMIANPARSRAAETAAS